MAGVRLNKFGGLLPRELPANLGAQMAQIAENIDLSRHSIKPWRKPKKLSSKTGQFLHREDCCEIVSSHCDASIADIRIGCGLMVATGLGQGYPVAAKVDDACAGNWTRLGFPCPLTAPVATNLTPLHAFEVTDHSRQYRSYVYRLKNRLGQYSEPSTASNFIDVNQQGMVQIDLPTTFPPEYGITELQIFRSEQSPDLAGNESASDFYLIGSVPIGTGIYFDNGEDIGDELDSIEHAPPSDNLRDVQHWKRGQLIGLSDNLVVFSIQNKPHAWPQKFALQLFRKPVSLLAGRSFAFVATDGQPSIISTRTNCDGDGCHDVTELSDSHPIISKRSAVLHDEHAIWATKDGLLMLAPSGKTTLLTQAYYTQDQWRAIQPETMLGIVHDGHYFGFTDTLSFRLKLPDATYDKVSDADFTTLNFSDTPESTYKRPMAAYRSDKDELFLVFDDGVYWWNESDQFMQATWRSSLMNMPAIAAFTAYKAIHDFADLTIEHWVDNERIDTEQVQSNRPYRLPNISGINWIVDIKTKGEVTEYHLATSVRDLSIGAM
jgi:hypothetical protein